MKHKFNSVMKKYFPVFINTQDDEEEALQEAKGALHVTWKEEA